MDFLLFHESNLSDPNPQTADIKSGYRGRESLTNFGRFIMIILSDRFLMPDSMFFNS